VVPYPESDKTKLGGLDLSRRQKSISLDGFQKLVSTIEKSRSRSRFLDLVSTSMSRPKSLDRDQEIRRDLKILAFLDSLSRSRSRSAWIFVFSCRDFSTNLDCVSTNLNNLDKNLDATKSRLKSLDFKNLDREKKKVDLNVMDNLDRFQKLVSTRWTFSISIGLERQDPPSLKKSLKCFSRISLQNEEYYYIVLACLAI
jgi:hypothetical protein